jgi:hypothetical protein
MRLLVCGSRTWAARDRLRAVVDGVARQVEDLVLIEGGASGADRLAGELAASGAGSMRPTRPTGSGTVVRRARGGTLGCCATAGPSWC